MWTKRKYEKKLDEKNLNVYDGRGKGIDVYECPTCKNRVHTIYRDKGVTPFMIPCQCGQIMHHNETVGEMYKYTIAKIYETVKVYEWYRPTYEEYTKMSPEMREHIELGGLILNDKDYDK